MRKMLLAIAKDIAGFFVSYAPVGCFLAGVVVLMCVLIMAYQRKGTGVDFGRASDVVKLRMRHILILFLLVFYLYVVLGITILSRNESPTREISLELFRTFRNTFQARKQIYENIIMFIPFSVLLYMLAEPFRKLWISLTMGICGSLLIETTQWVTMTGHFELDDILTNTIGMLIGYLGCMIVEKVVNRIKCK